MSISAKEVQELRKMSGAGMMECKSALNDSNGNVKEAFKLLREKGIAKAEKKSSNSAIKILRGYAGFEEPQFYQGSQWRFVRQSTNQNSKQKHYDKGDYDQVQYYFPNADVEENNTDGE